LGDYLVDFSEGWLSPGKNGSHLTARAVEKILEKRGRMAGMKVTPHRLRHTFCKMLVDAGESQRDSSFYKASSCQPGSSDRDSA